MRLNILTIALVLAAGVAVNLPLGCSSEGEPKPIAEKNGLTEAELIARGQYLTTVSGCNDCHSPKIFTPQGPHPDSSRLLSGHPEGSPLPPVDKRALQPGYWLMFSGDITAYVGPWGMSFAANLTPDSTTGIGAWTEEAFIGTLRTGRHLGQEGGRQIAPPMPWQLIGKMTDEDLKSIYTYLKSIPPIKNRVPAPTPPNEL